MKVTLIHKTEDAEDLLIFTKMTRLSMNAEGMATIRAWPPERKRQELAYMAKTIPSSWEFVHLTFLVEGVSRACAQQMTRTRTASYAMQSQRVTDVRDMNVVRPFFATDEQRWFWEKGVTTSLNAYNDMVDTGVPLQDARGVLPMNIACNLVAQYNLRAFSDVLKARKSMRAQGEYADVARAMEAATLEAWPWAEPFFASPNETVIEILEEVIRDIGVTTGHGPGWNIAKAVDLIRKG